ncbi:putative cytochrome p450 protein [Botrytis fragariae]|uniref:Putative cytochrome p450 protein n=1 Tax=Botrytis fragariae TaxID=1964551 RepID=A0A8H6ANP1_9HELO|nr:putative cytochrome p450 protein [Botrytis fragariae]KAF5870711.1 putative cytochrome p450 protein [Botrytis fragariae]
MDIIQIAMSSFWISLCATILFYTVLLYLYRITLHPLASFLDPRLAPITLWYEFYHDFFDGGRYIFKIKEMQENYGPIVRVTLDGLQINDPSFVPELMPAAGRRRNKCVRLMQMFGFVKASAATIDHDSHRMRRGPMSKFFSKESIRRIEPRMKLQIEKLFARLREFQETGEPINCLPMFGAFTNDLISEYAFGFNPNWLGAPNFNAAFYHMMDGFHNFGPLAVQFSWFIPMINAIPKALRQSMNPGGNKFVEFKQELLSNIDKANRAKAASLQEGKEVKTLFDEITASKIPEIEKQRSRLLDEARNILIAGTETTSLTLSALTFYLLSNPKILVRLRDELKTALPDPSIEPILKDME